MDVVNMERMQSRLSTLKHVHPLPGDTCCYLGGSFQMLPVFYHRWSLTFVSCLLRGDSWVNYGGLSPWDHS